MCDSGPLISFSDTCLISVLPFLAKLGAEFLITPAVEKEIVLNPINVHRYAFSAIRLHKTIDDKLLRVIDVDSHLMNRIMNSANAAFLLRGKPMKLIHAGEAACLAAYKQNGCSALAIDEKTTRLLIENPALLADNISEQFGQRIIVDKRSLDEFTSLTSGIEIIRASELLAIATKNGYFDSFGKHKEQAFHTAIYALKQAGCSLSEKEVNDYQKLKF